MRRMLGFLLLFVFVGILPIMANASDSFNTVYGQDEDLLHFDFNKNLEQLLQIIEERVNQINPEIVEKYVNYDKYEKFYNYQRFLAHRVYETKTKQFIDMFQKHAESKGYKVTKTSEGIYGSYNLELPRYMKSPECYENENINGFRKCEYPKDYDFSFLTITNNTIFFSLDDMETMYMYHVILNDLGGDVGDKNKEVESGDHTLQLAETKQSHNEYIEYENRHIYCDYIAEIPYAKEANKCSKNSFLTKKCAEIMQLHSDAHDECLGEYSYLPDTDVKVILHYTLYNSQRHSIK